MMKTTLTTILLISLCACPALAGLKISATTDKSAYNPGETGQLILSLSVDPGDSPVGVTTVAGIGVTPPVFSFSGAGGSGAPTFLGPGGAKGVGVSPFQLTTIPPDSFATPFIPPPQQTVPVADGAPVAFALFNFLFNGGTYQFEVNGLEALNGEGTIAGSQVSGAIPGGVVTAVPEPSSFLLLGLVGTGAVAVNSYRKRKLATGEDSENEEEVAV